LRASAHGARRLGGARGWGGGAGGPPPAPPPIMTTRGARCATAKDPPAPMVSALAPAPRSRAKRRLEIIVHPQPATLAQHCAQPCAICLPRRPRISSAAKIPDTSMAEYRQRSKGQMPQYPAAREYGLHARLAAYWRGRRAAGPLAKSAQTYVGRRLGRNGRAPPRVAAGPGR